MTDPAPTPLRPLSAVDRTAPGDPGTARAAVAGFGAAVLRHALGAELRNTAISPYSLFMVLAMARAGARGATAAQIDAALGLDGTAAQGQAVAAVDQGISRALDRAVRMSSDGVTVRSANEMWVDRGFPVRPEFVDELAREFGVAARSADFAGDPDGMRAAINAWVAERTNDLIPDLLPAGSVTAVTELVLVNALYLKAAWMVPFRDRQEGSFTTADGSRRTVPMMQGGMPFSGSRGAGWTAVSIPYIGGGLSMTVLLPDAGIDTVLGDLPAVLDAVATGSATPAQFAVTLPAFSIDATPDAMSAVRALGVTDLFDAPDLTGITDRPLAADTLVHRCVVDVDEKGTEAAAATALLFSRGVLAQPEPLVIDRPFLFWIAESSTSAPLFLGVVADPSGAPS
ncbi:serpin family protein [Nakamurella flava]|uniref:Serpin family protein n=1 Tax=Nakamurella flava TaxID=2576308 RepID=A0A4U6Q918_9ACTN|nr:serpin family protein [Nakamurella flava]TKV56377.1 serpin family protein [Nakamurella flava]